MKLFPAFILFLVLTPSAHAEESIIIVKAVQGEAVLSSLEGNDVPVALGMKIPDGAALESDYQGSVDVSIDGKAGFRFLPDTKVTFLKVSAPGKTNLRLEHGNIIACVKGQIDPRSTFEIETPTAVLAVTGTQFWGRVVSPGENPMTSFAVREGVVEITAKSNGKVYTLKKGEAVELPVDASQIILREAAEEELAAIALSETIEI